MITASKAGLLRKCQYWAKHGVQQDHREESEAATLGTSVHKAIDEYISTGLIYTPIGSEVDVLFGHARAWIDEHQEYCMHGFLSEVAYAWDPAFNRAMKIIGQGQRFYADKEVWQEILRNPGMSPHTVPMTIDLMCENYDGSISIYDWCTGRTDKTAQLQINALAVWYTHRPTEVRCHALRLTEDGCVQEDLGVYDEWDIEQLAKEYSDLIYASIGAEPSPGMHCTELYCPAKNACPVTQNAIEQVIPVGHLNRYKLSPEIQNASHASYMLPMIKLAKAYIETVESSLKSYAKSAPIITQDGKEWGPGTRKHSHFSKADAIRMLEAFGASESDINSLTKTTSIEVFAERKRRE